MRFEGADAYKAKQSLFLHLVAKDEGDPAPLLRELMSEVRRASHSRSTYTRNRPTCSTRTSSHSLYHPHIPCAISSCRARTQTMSCAAWA